MAQTVVGFFDKQTDAQQAVQELLSKGFTNDNVNLSGSAAGAGTGSTDYTLNTDHNESGVKGFFKNLFGNDDDSTDKYSTVASRSNSMVTVYAASADEAEKAADILDDNGAVDIDEKSGEYGYSNKAKAMDTTGLSAQPSTDANQSIKVIEENLEVGKRTVQTGGVRLRSRIVEHPVEEQLRLRQESVTVNRNTVNRTATEADFAAFKEGEVEMIESKEVPVVAKQARVVEEVSLGKDVTERNETIKDTVRKTEVDIEDMDGTDTIAKRTDY